jgi:hypothetical protein
LLCREELDVAPAGLLAGGGDQRRHQVRVGERRQCARVDVLAPPYST